MYVVYTRLCLQYFHILLLAQCPQYFSYVFFQLPIDFFPAILRCKYDVILTTVSGAVKIYAQNYLQAPAE